MAAEPGSSQSDTATPGVADEPATAVALAVAGLDGLATVPTVHHVAAFERVHAALTDALASIDGV